MNTRHEKDQLSAAHYDRKWKEIIPLMPQGGDYCFYMRQYGYDIIKDAIPAGSNVFDYACGLGVIDKQLVLEKECFVYGCDISKVAISYIKKQGFHHHKKSFQATTKIFSMPDDIDIDKYDYILAVYFIEHIPDPVALLNEALEYGQRVIFNIPNNFKQVKEHALMKWHDWNSFYDLFRDFELTRIDEGKYHPWLPAAYHHPTFICEKK